MMSLSVILIVTLATPIIVKANAQGNQQLDQMRKIAFEKYKCHKRIENTRVPSNGLYCNMTFDNVMCWSYTPAGTMAKQHCAPYIMNFIVTEYATRTCMEDGTWERPGTGNKTWSNYSACIENTKAQPQPPDVDPLIIEHIATVVLISKMGYSISLAVLLLAITVMLVLKRLHCQRNIVHVNLFVSFALRAVLCLLKETVQGTGTSPQPSQMGASLSTEGTHWECKLLFTMLHYALGANYMWIFVEGLYLHTLVILTVFSHKHVFKYYIILGWISPLLFVIPWVFVRIYKENTLCWNTHQGDYYWILKAPIIASIFVNFFFFINIIRVLFTKLMARNTRAPQRYRKLAKSTLVLIPLFGVYYILFIIIPDDLTPKLKVIKLYTETALNSFQGVIVALLFCFLNGEVRAELLKKWRRHRLRRDSRLGNTRASRGYSTGSFFLQERGSVTAQNFTMVDMDARNSITAATMCTDNDNSGVDSEGSPISNRIVAGVTSSDVGENCGNNVVNHKPVHKTLSPVDEFSEESVPILFEKPIP